MEQKQKIVSEKYTMALFHVTSPLAHQISIRCRGLIAAVNELIGVAIFQSVLEQECDS